MSDIAKVTAYFQSLYETTWRQIQAECDNKPIFYDTDEKLRIQKYVRLKSQMDTLSLVLRVLGKNTPTNCDNQNAKALQIIQTHIDETQAMIDTSYKEEAWRNSQPSYDYNLHNDIQTLHYRALRKYSLSVLQAVKTTIESAISGKAE
jgi:hypothetical protein